MIVRTRFAPSPTGYLHVGGARTALFSYLFAKKHNGVFILRIEDTDLERSTEEAVQAIHEGMAWLGLNADEGPFYQTKRFDRYHAVIKEWLDQGLAYRCTCSKERLETLRETQLTHKEKPRYDGHCRHLSLGPEIAQPFVVRFKNPTEGEVTVHDAVHGDVVFQNKELDDLIIARSDGSPTYNFTVVVDDADMNITHVIRGDDHLNNTPRQINMLRAMNATIPIYAHLPMILGADGKKLSKRHGAVSVMQFRDEGFLPKALLNYLVRLGWSHGDQEIFSMPEMIDYFSLDHLSKSAAIFDQNKLLWLNQHYIKTSLVAETTRALQWQLDHLGLSSQQGPSSEALILAFRERAKTLKEMAEHSAVFFGNPPCPVTPPLLEENVRLAIKDLHAHLDTTSWELDPLHDLVKTIVEKHQLKFAQLGKPLREILINNASNLPVHTLLYLLGQKNSLQRLAAAL